MLLTPLDYPNQNDSITIPKINQRTQNLTPTPDCSCDFIKESIRERAGMKGMLEIRNLGALQYEERKVESMQPGPS